MLPYTEVYKDVPAIYYAKKSWVKEFDNALEWVDTLSPKDLADSRATVKERYSEFSVAMKLEDLGKIAIEEAMP